MCSGVQRRRRRRVAVLRDEVQRSEEEKLAYLPFVSELAERASDSSASYVFAAGRSPAGPA